MIVGGDPIAAAEALREGVVDEIVEGDLTAAAVAFATPRRRRGPAARPCPRPRRQVARGARRHRRLRGGRGGPDAAPERPRRAGGLRRVGAQRHHPAVRRRVAARERVVPQARHRRPVAGDAPRLLRRARGVAGPRHAGQCAAAADRQRRGDRLGHDGRRHRDVLCQCRHPGDPRSMPAASSSTGGSTGSPATIARRCRAAGSALTRWSGAWR